MKTEIPKTLSFKDRLAYTIYKTPEMSIVAFLYLIINTLNMYCTIYLDGGLVGVFMQMKLGKLNFSLPLGFGVFLVKKFSS